MGEIILKKNTFRNLALVKDCISESCFCVTANNFPREIKIKSTYFTWVLHYPNDQININITINTRDTLWCLKEAIIKQRSN